VAEVKRPWFVVKSLPHDVVAIDEPTHGYNVISYLVCGSERAALLDTGVGVGDLRAEVDALTERAPVVIQTHVHTDHIGASHRFDEVYVHPADAAALRRGSQDAGHKEETFERNRRRRMLPAGVQPNLNPTPGIEPTRLIEEGDSIALGGRQLEVFHTPGHTPGGISLLDRANRLLFTGDSLYSGNVLVLDPEAYMPAIVKLAELAAEVDVIYGAHFSIPTDPGIVPAMRDAYLTIWEGRRPRDTERGNYDHFRFDGFGFILPQGRYSPAYAKE
jgi:glyoxylase-like metal-dependent hydrolase (beta-lactamase superfamily II)